MGTKSSFDLPMCKMCCTDRTIGEWLFVSHVINDPIACKRYTGQIIVSFFVIQSMIPPNGTIGKSLE